MNKSCFLLVLTIAQAFMLGGCATFIEGNYVVNPGRLRKSIHAVDATVEIKPQARTRGINTVDGHITLGKWAQTGALRTVDASIEMDAESICRGDVYDVAGTVRLMPGTRVTGDIRTVTGTIHADGALVEGDIEAVSGKLQLSGHTHIQGSIVISSPNSKTGYPEQELPPLVVIGPTVVVEGGIRSTHGGEVWLSRTNNFIGAVSGVQVHWYDGDEPDGWPLNR